MAKENEKRISKRHTAHAFLVVICGAFPQSNYKEINHMAIHLYAKGFGESYRVSFESGRYILRPTSGKPYQWLTATPEQLKKNFKLFPIFGLV